jgi:hypothetical protein
MQVREEYVRERMKTWEVVLDYINTKEMLADLLTKPLGGKLYHHLTQKLLGGHCYGCSNNMGVKRKSTGIVYNLACIESLIPVLEDLTCSHFTSGQPIKKHTTKHVPAANTKLKQRNG